MSTKLGTLVLIGTVLAMPTAVSASAPVGQPRSSAVTHQAATPAAATHATKGVVKSVSATSLVITRTAAGKERTMTFVMNPATERQGNLAVGSPVEVRYRVEAKQRIATAVNVQQPKVQAASGSASSHR